MPFTKTASIKFLNTLVDAVDITVVDFDTEVRVARYARANSRVSSSGSGSRAQRVDRAVRRDPRVSGRRRRPGRAQDHAALYRRRRHPQLHPVQRADRPAQGVGRHRLRHRRARTPVVVGARCFSGHPPADRGRDRRAGVLPAGRERSRPRVRQGPRRDTRAVQSAIVSTNDKTDGAWRKVEIKVVTRKGDYRSRSRKGYFAPYKKPPDKPKR